LASPKFTEWRPRRTHASVPVQEQTALEPERADVADDVQKLRATKFSHSWGKLIFLFYAGFQLIG
jgi:hypothetical protein